MSKRAVVRLFVLASLAAVGAVHAQQVELISKSAFPLDTAGGVPPLGRDSVSDDGRFMVFVSNADNLVTGQVDANGANDVFVFDRVVNRVSLVSHAGTLDTAGNGASDSPVISGDGSWIAFRSTASNLGAGFTDGNGVNDVFLYERATGAITLVSRTSSPTTTGNAASGSPSVSLDGGYVAFQSGATDLGPGFSDANGADDVFLFDRAGGTISLVSHTAVLGQTAGGASTLPQLSADGGYVAFSSSATNLGSGFTDTNGVNDVFLYERATGSIALMSHTSSLTTAGNGSNGSVAISGDGGVVTFLSGATNLGPGFTDGNGAFDIFVFERATGSISLASHTSSTITAGNGNSNSPMVSRDGSWIAFVSSSSNLGSGITDGNGTFTDVFLYERATGILTLVSHASTPSVTANRTSANPRLSQDGSWVAFSSNATDIGVGLTDTNGAQSDVFLFQRATAAISLVSHTALTTTTGNLGSDSLALSAGGGFVAFRSSASDLGPGFVEHAGTDAYLYERATAGIVAASRADGPASATGGGVSYTTGGTRYSVSDDGRYVVFSSEAPNLVPGVVDRNGSSDVFLYDRVTGTLTLVSHAAPSTTAANSTSNEPVISADGSWVAFQSSATNLVPGQSDTNTQSDTFLYERATGALTLVSRTSSATTAGDGRCAKPRISAAGDYVAFESTSSNLGSGFTDTNAREDVFLFERATGTIVLASHTASATTASNGFSVTPSLSADGRYVAFQSDSSNLGSGIAETNLVADAFLFDRVTGAISVVTHTSSLTTTASFGGNDPEISSDGNWVAFVSSSNDLGSGFSNPSSTQNVFLYARAGGAISLVSHTSSPTVAGNGTSYGPDLSGDGRYVAFVTDASDLGTGLTDGNSATDVFLYDGVGGGLTVVSHSASPTQTANDFSDKATISRDGGVVAFRSWATDLGTGFTDVAGTTDIFRWSRAGGAISLVSHVPSSLTTAGNLDSDQPVIGGDGNHVAFQSTATDLWVGDRNAASDVFLYSQAGCAPGPLAAAGNGNNRIDLTWSSPGAYTYAVKRSRTPGGPYVTIGSVLGTSFSDVAAEGGVTYYYRVSNGCGLSNETSASTTGACQLPPDFVGASSVFQPGGATCAVQVGWSPASLPCGGGVTYAVYRDTSPAFVPDVTNRLASRLTGASYVDTAGVLLGTTYYYVVRATGLVNGEEDPNEVRVSLAPISCTSSGAAPVPFFDVRSGDGENTLDWVNPGGTFSQTRITFTSDGSAPACPAGTDVPGSPFLGTPGQRVRSPHAGLGNGTLFRYAACAEGPAVTPSAGVESVGRPENLPGKEKWGYATGATALATAGVVAGDSYFVVSNDRILHALAAGPGGGAWAAGAPEWIPYRTSAPVQGRPTAVRLPVTTVMGARMIVLMASQDGRVYAIDGETGNMLWQSPVLGAAVQAAPSAIFRDFGAPYDLIFVGTREPAGNSKFYALRLADGSIAWSFDNGGGSNGIGIISGQAQVDAAASRVYFTSRRRGGGSQDTVWCLSYTDTSRTKEWSVNVGDVDAGPILRGSVLYVGDNQGEVEALNPANGSPLWGAPYATGDGPVKGYVWPDVASGRLYFSTTGLVHAIQTDGSPFWAGAVVIGSPSPPVLRGGRVYMGGDNSRVYSIDATSATPGAPTSVVVGDPLVPKVVGSPTFDTPTSLLIVGTDLGVIYAVPVPF